MAAWHCDLLCRPSAPVADPQRTQSRRSRGSFVLKDRRRADSRISHNSRGWNMTFDQVIKAAELAFCFLQDGAVMVYEPRSGCIRTLPGTAASETPDHAPASSSMAPTLGWTHMPRCRCSHCANTRDRRFALRGNRPSCAGAALRSMAAHPSEAVAEFGSGT